MLEYVLVYVVCVSEGSMCLCMEYVLEYVFVYVVCVGDGSMCRCWSMCLYM